MLPATCTDIWRLEVRVYRWQDCAWCKCRALCHALCRNECSWCTRT